MKGPLFRFVVVLLFLFSPLTSKALAANLYWVGADGADASVASNWKTTNPAGCGGGDAGAAPGASDAVIFDPDCDNGASIDSGFASTVTSLNMNTGYGGVVTLARSLQTTSTFTQSGGVFNAVSFALDVDSTFTMDTGATFRASSGTMTFAGSFTINGGTFDKDTNSGGTVTFDGSTTATLSCNSIVFNVVNISKAAGTNSISVGSACTLPISGTNPSSTGYVTNNGTINVTGNWTIAGKYISNTGAVLAMTGTTLTINGPVGGSGTLTMNGGTFPAGVTAITIDSGTLVTSANLIPDGIDLTLTGLANFSATCGSEAWNSVTISRSVSYTFTINSGCSFPLAGTNPVSTGKIVNNGIISVTGNWTVTEYTANTGSQLIMTGTSFSTSFGDLILNGGTFPSGITTLTVASGSLDNTGNLLPNGIDLTMSGSFVTTITCGTAQFDSLTIDKSGTAARAVDNCTVGDFTLTAGGFSNPTSPVTYNITGNFSHVSTTLGGANLTMEFSGSNSQTLSKTGGTFSSIFKVNKTGTNALSLTTDFSTSGQTCTVAAGIFDLSGYSFSCESTFTVQSGGSLRIFGHENPTTPVLDSGSTVIYKGNGDSAGNGYIPKNWSYKNLTAAFTDSGDYLGGASSDSLPNNLVGYWKMDEGSGSQVDDSSTNSNIGNITNAIFSSTVQALDISNPYSLDFDGSGDYLDMGNDLSIAQSVSVFSTAAWIRKDTVSGVDQVFGLSTGTSTSNSRVHLATNGDEVECVARAGDAEAAQTRTTTASNLVISTWYHIACNIDYANDTISIYVNGALASSTGTITFTATSTSNTASQRSSIGIDEDKAGNDFDGQIDEVRAYNRLLTQTEIEALGTAFTTMVVPSLTVSENVLISSGAIVSPTTFNIGGSFTNSSTFTHNSGTVVFNGTSGTKTITSGGTSFYGLTINDGGGTLTTQLEDALDVNNNLTITGGTLDTKSGENNQINVGGSWSNSDTFTARSGTVVLDGTSQTISGSTTFNSLTKNVTSAATLTLPASSTQTIGGTMNLSGTSGNLLSLRSSSSPTQARIDPQGTRTISYLDVKDNYNINSTFIATSGFNVTNSGGNTGWNFTLPSATTPGSISQATNASGYLTFSTVISEPDLQNTRLKVEYSDDGGTSWYDPDLVSATPNTGTVSLDDAQAYQIGQADLIDTSGGDVTLTIVWDSKSASNGNGSLDNTNQTDIRVRVTPNDFGEDGTAMASASFEIDNLDPSGLAGLAATSTATTATLTWTSATEANFNHYEIWYGTTQADVESRSGTATEWDNDNDADLATVSTAETTISPLTNGLTYYFRIWAVDDFGNEAFAATISKLIIVANYDPNTPTSLGGSNLVNGNWGTDSTPTFTFTLSDSDTGDTVKYRIQIDDSSDFSSAVVDYTSALAAQGSFSFTVGQAAGSGSYTTGSSGQTLSDGSYYWRVRTIDNSSAESAYTTANSGAVAFRTDTSAPTQPSLDSPGDNSYTNSTRPGFRWRTSTDTGSGLSSYSLEIDNGDSGDFSITGIPTSRTTDYETNTYLIKYEGFSDSDANNNYITVYTKSSVDWSGGNNNGLLKEGKRGWTVKAYDVAGAEASGSRNLFVDLTAPAVNVSTVGSEPVASVMTVSDRNPILVGVATDPLGNAIASSPKEISISIDKVVKGKKSTTYQNVVSTTISVPKIYWTSDDSLITDNTQQKSAKYYPFSYKIAQKLALGDYRATIGGSDQAGNGASGQTFTFKILAESTVTEIFGVRAIEIATNSAQIVWFTNHPATSKVNYGTGAEYGESVLSSSLVESHVMLLTGLSPGTGYHFEVISTGNTTASDSQNSFITLAFITPTPEPTPTLTPEPTPDIIEDLITFVSTPAAILDSYISSASASVLPMVSGITISTIDLLEEVVEQIAAVREEIVDSPPAAAAVRTSSVIATAAVVIALVAIVAAAIQAGVVAATIVPPAASLILSPNLIQRFASGVQHFLATFFTGLGLIKRRRKSVGVVINAVDDSPIANANLLFYSASGNLKITFTDNDGRFDVKAASDTYQIKAQKAGYIFPSLTLTIPENDKYAHIYRAGDNYEIVGEPLYEIAVPMDPEESPLAAVRMFLRVKNYLSYILIRYHLLISLTGVISSGLGAWVYPSNLTYFSLIVYSITLVLSLHHTLMRETWGKVFDASGKPMVNMLLRLYRQLPDRLDLYTSLTTDKDGRYLITPEPGDYVLQVVDTYGKVVKSRSLIINPGHPRLDEKITVR